MEVFNMAKEEQSEIDSDVMDEEMQDGEEEKFEMNQEEMDEAKSSAFNPFWSTKNMENGKAYKFKVISEGIKIRSIKDKFNKGKPSARMIISVEELATGALYDIASRKDANEEGNYTSLTAELRKLYALCEGKMKGKMFGLTKRTYKHKTFGDTDGFSLNMIEPDSPMSE
jgi:hypothetical protein